MVGFFYTDRTNNIPLCGIEWLYNHRNDHTQAEIDNLAIEVRVSGRLQARVKSGKKKDRHIIREVVRANSNE